MRPSSPTQLMGNLPAERITPSRSFSSVGVDYAGPYTIKVSRNKTAKVYLCLFVYLTTKAVHFEIVSDMTTLGFLNAFKRFISRRGRCKTIYSDNGTNFVGANNMMQQFGNLITNCWVTAADKLIDKTRTYNSPALSISSLWLTRLFSMNQCLAVVGTE